MVSVHKWALIVVIVFVDSYIGMDQSLDLKLDVKEAAVIPAEEPEYGISESESEHNNNQVEHESEFFTDSEEED